MYVCMYVFSLILDSSVGLSAGIQSAGEWASETPWVRILHSAEEDNLSPFVSKIACLCQSIEINNNKYVCMCICMCMCMYACTHAQTHTHKHTYTHVHVHTHKYTYANIYAYTYSYTHAYTVIIDELQRAAMQEVFC